MRLPAAFARLCALVGVAGCAKSTIDDWAPLGEPSAPTVRTIAQGELVGVETARGAYAWLGVPFAEPPVDELRFRAPRPPEPWSGRLEAVSPGPRCPQMTNGLNQSEGIAAGLRVGEEDCLRLNIYAPRGAAPGADLPVMYWIHGGGNVWGRAGSYDPSDLVANENVIVVTVQYRLGPLGWFASEALRADAAGSNEPLDASANFAALDLIQGLKWVRNNIRAFGGDPSAVTIFGESAGGHNVAMLLAAPQAAGLFQRAILQSGSFDSVPREEAEAGGPDLVNPSTEIMQRLGASTADDLRRISLDDLFAAYRAGETGGFLGLPTVVAGDPVIPTATLADAFSSTATFNAVPIMTGSNKDEMKLFQALDPALVNAYIGLIVVPKDQDFYDALSDYQSRFWRIRSVDEAAAAMAGAGHDEVWAYRFDWDEGGRFLFSNFATLFGAAHAFEIPFVMGRFEFLGAADRFVFARKTEQSRRALSRKMQAYWAAFARGGAPAAADVPAWPVYASRDGAVLMRFDSEEDAGVGVIQGADSLERLLSDLVEDDRIDAAGRCRIAEALVSWAPKREAAIRAGAACPAGE